MARLMYDAVTVADLPADSTMVAGYADGLYANMPALAARFPNALRVSIAVTASLDDAQVLDVENGNATPAEAPGWVLMRRRSGADPSVYCDASTWPAVQEAFTAAGVAPPHYWIASYDGDPAIPVGAVAHQYASNSSYDTSSVAEYWPGVDPTPEDDMPLTTADAELVVSTLLNSVLPDVGVTNPDGSPATRTVAEYFEYLDSHYRALAAQNTALAAQVTALSAAVAAVEAALTSTGHAATPTAPAPAPASS